MIDAPIEILKILVKHGAKTNCYGGLAAVVSGSNIYCLNGHKINKKIKFLINSGIDIHSYDEYVMRRYIKAGVHITVLYLIVTYNCCVDACNDNGLYNAFYFQNSDMVEILLMYRNASVPFKYETISHNLTNTIEATISKLEKSNNIILADKLIKIMKFRINIDDNIILNVHYKYHKIGYNMRQNKKYFDLTIKF